MAPNRETVTFVLPSDGYRIDDFVQAADTLGVDLIIATEAHHGLAEDMGHRIIPIDLNDEPDAAKRIAASPHPMNAIVPLDDHGVTIAAQAASYRGLVHNSQETATATRDKLAMRQRLDGAVLQPGFAPITMEDDPRQVAESLGGPVVLKPLRLAGSVGVIRVDTPAQATDAATRIRQIQADHGYLADNPLLCEQYVDGAEVSVDGLVTDGTWETLAIFDKPGHPHGPVFPERHFVTPTRQPDSMQRAIVAACAAAAEAVGIVRGPVHAEFRVVDDTVVLLELASRSIGGLCGRALRFGLSETPLEELLIRNALGKDVRGTRLSPGASGVSMIPVPRAGTFDGIGGVTAASEVEGITDIEVSRIVGKAVRPLPDESTYLGFVFARASTADEVERSLRSAVGRLDVQIS